MVSKHHDFVGTIRRLVVCCICVLCYNKEICNSSLWKPKRKNADREEENQVKFWSKKWKTIFEQNPISKLCKNRICRRALWLTSSILLFNGIPQLILVILRIYWDWENAGIKQLVSTCFLSKSLANVILFFTTNDNKKKFLTLVRRLISLRKKVLNF